MSATQQATETPDLYGAYPRLSEDEIEGLATRGERRKTRAGDVLLREGDRDCEFFVILDGMVAIVEGYERDERLIGLHGPGRFLGEVSLLTGEAVPLTAVVREPGEVLALSVEDLRQAASESPELGDLILRSFLLRRTILIGLGTGFRIIGSRYSPDARRLREFAIRNRLPHRFIDVEQDPEAEALLTQLGIPAEHTPIVIWRGETVLRNPSNAELARAIGLSAAAPPQELCDLIVVGSGPAGLAAAVYGASEGLATVALDAVATGGQAGTSPKIENYLGFPMGISGSELAERATIQAKKFGARLALPAEAVALEEDGGQHVVRLADDTTLCGRTVVLSMGARYRKLALDGLERFEGVSIFYAATIAEAQMCSGDPVAVVGGGNSAAQASLFLAAHVPRVHLVIAHADLGRDMSRYLADRVRRHPGVEVVLNTVVCELVGDEALRALVLENRETGEREKIEARAMFVFIGAEPHTSWLAEELELDENGFILTGAAAGSKSNGALLLETSRPGVFAAGDARSGSIKRVASAAGEGAMAVRLVHEYLGQQHSWQPPGQV